MNRVYDIKIYNEETKQKWLNKYPMDTQRTYRRVFQNSSIIEKELNTDLLDFNRQEIDQLLYHMNPPSLAASQSNGRIVTAYIQWAIEQGLRVNNINPLKVVDVDYFRQFINNTIENYISEHDLIKLEGFCANYQDSVIFRLIFESVLGEGATELINLKKEDVDFKNKTLLLTDEDGSKRKIEVSPTCIAQIEGALEQEKYFKRNGEAELKDNQLEYNDLVQNDYILRSAITRTHSYDKIHKHTIYRRINTIRDLYGIPALTTKNILRSGMIKMGKDLLEEEGILEKKQLEKICERFGVVNWYTLKEFINEKQIKKLYPN